MARRYDRIPKFNRVVSALGGETRREDAQDMKNLRVDGFRLRPRYGYSEVAGNPVIPLTDPYAILGLGYVTAQNGTSEFLSVETHNVTTRPYSINPTTFARTQIGTGTLATGNWLFTSFGDNAYAINPGGTKTVYRHAIGNNSSFTALEDVAYVAPNSPNLTITLDAPATVSVWASSDTISFVNSNAYAPGTITKTFNADGSMLLNGPSTDGGGPPGGYLEITQVFSSSKDFSGADYFYINLTGENYLKFFTSQTTLPQFRIAGVWTNVTDAKWFHTGTGKQATWVIYANGMTLTAVEGIRFRMSCKPERRGAGGASENFVTISPLFQGGYYLESTAPTQRLWDPVLVGNGITYGVRFTDGGLTVSNIEDEFISAAGARGAFASTFSCPTGARVIMTSNEPTAPYDRVQFLRLDQSVDPPIWKELNTDTTEPFLHQDVTLESAVPGLPTITSGTSPAPVPVFRTQGIRGAFPYKQSMIWLINSGEGNIQISRVGNPEELFDPAASYGLDPTQPAQRTLADNQGDRPVWGAQAGQIAFIVGENAAYALYGETPSTFSPSRQIPGSRGIAGPYAGARMRPDKGEYAVAYADPNLNVWMINSVPVYTDDTNAKPFEISLPVRGKIKQFLFDEQKGEFPTLSIDNTHVVFQEATSSLWVILGRRAAVYRQDITGNGWEFYEYRLTVPPGSEDITTCTVYTSSGAGVSTVNRTGWTKDFTTFGNALISDDAYAQAMMFTSDITKYLRASTLAPSPLIPVAATLNEVRVRIEHSNVGKTPVKQDAAYLLISGSQAGGNNAVSGLIPETDTQVTYIYTPPFPTGLTIANLNAGNIGFELGYESLITADHNNPANWTFSVTPPGTTNTSGTANTTVTNVKTVTVTYTGPGSPPPFVYFNFTSTATVTASYLGAPPAPPANWMGSASIDNGLGDTNSGMIEAPTVDHPGSISVTGSGLVKITMSGNTGTYVVNQVGSTSVAGTGFDSTVVSGSVTGTFSAYTASTLRVDAMEISVCYTVTNSTPGATSGISWDRVSFSPNGVNLAGRSSGQLDLIEFDSRSDNYINGPNRDSGYPMPDWHWESIRLTFEGVTARLCGVQVNTIEQGDAFVCQAKTENTGGFVTGTPTGTSLGRWVRFPVTQAGIQHTIKLSGTEDNNGIDGVAIEYQQLSRAKAD